MDLNINNRPVQPSFKGITRYIVKKEDLPISTLLFAQAKMYTNPRKATYIFETPSRPLMIKIYEELKDRAHWFNSHMELNKIDFKLPNPLDKDTFSYYFIYGKDYKRFIKKFSFLRGKIRTAIRAKEIIKETPQIKNMSGGRDYLTLKLIEKEDMDFEKFLQKRKINKIVDVEFFKMT